MQRAQSKGRGGGGNWNAITSRFSGGKLFTLGSTIARGLRERGLGSQKCVIDSLTFVAFQLTTWFEENTLGQVE